MSFALTLFVEANFVLVLLGAGLAYELGRTLAAGLGARIAYRWTAVLVVLVGTVTVSLTAPIFWEGLKAGLLTFGGPSP